MIGHPDTTKSSSSNRRNNGLRFVLAAFCFLLYAQQSGPSLSAFFVVDISSERSVDLSNFSSLYPQPSPPQNATNNTEELLLPIQDSWKGYKNRTITFVHVGKAGGMSFRRSTSLACRLSKVGRSQNDAELEPCLRRYFPPNATLSRQVRHYFHMFAYQKEALQQSTSFLFVLRNPVDRIVSAYRYSHPENCPNPKATVKSWGCYVKKFLNESKNPISSGYEEYSVCFPSAAMEDFAQSVMSPWKNRSNNNETKTKTIMSPQQQMKCRQLARQMVQGQGRQRPNPHMKYNYLYYRQTSLDQYPNREVFGIRTEFEWEDVVALDKAIGGTGVFQNEGKIESHGSEQYQPSPLSEEAYQKLCCTLHEEIAVYQTIVDQVLNLNATQKQECKDDVYRKCGITSWEDWKQQCEARLKQDQMQLSLPSDFHERLRERLNLTKANGAEPAINAVQSG